MPDYIDVLREDFSFGDDFGYPPNQATIASNTFAPEYLPYGQGPVGQQMYLNDQWEMLAKCFYSWHHDPVAHQLVQLVVYFVLGRGIQIICKDERVQDAIDEFWEREQMDERLKVMVQDLTRDGEIFVRTIRNDADPLVEPGKTTVRLIDPNNIYEIVTKARDIERVQYYKFVMQTRTQIYPPKDGSPSQEYIIQDIDPSEIIHVKINCGANEVRGRSDLFPMLGYMKRLRDYMTAEILKAFAAAMIQYDYTVKGGPGDVTRLQGQVTPPTMTSTGNAFWHNDAVEVKVVQADKVYPTASGSIYEGLLNFAAIGGGVPKDYLGVTSRGARGTQLLAAEPGTKRFEERQQLVKTMVERLVKTVINEARGKQFPMDADTSFRADFPSISSSDKDLNIKLLCIGEAMQWWSKQAAAERAASELGMSEYDYESARKAIQLENEPGHRTLIWDSYAQTLKGLPGPDEIALPKGDVPNPAYSPDGAQHAAVAPNGAVAPHAPQQQPGEDMTAKPVSDQASVPRLGKVANKTAKSNPHAAVSQADTKSEFGPHARESDKPIVIIP